ncbi:MAG: 2,3-bisphosphoglycerate-independent phosphoglycerate mutase [bacterium]
MEGRRGLLLIADGMGDRPCKVLKGKTPLEAARRPNMDALAGDGECGLMDVIAPGIRCGSDTGHLAMLGYDPRKVYTGRGPFEALGIGMEVKGGDIAFRCNFSTATPDMVVTDRRAGRIKEGTKQLTEAVDGAEIDGILCLFKESVAHRGALVLRGPGLSPMVSDADPHAEGEKVHEAKPLDNTPEAKKTAEVINKWVKLTYERLKDAPLNKQREAEGLPPANIILPRGAGAAPHIGNFNKQNNVNAACVVETGLVRGIARFVGMTILDAPGATGGPDSDLNSIADTIVEAFKDHNFVLCNVKAPDQCGHDNDPELKCQVIEKFDSMVGYLMKRLPEDTIVAITADHSTPCEVKDHSGDPVPLLVCGPGVRRDDVAEFHELTVYKGALQRVRGTDLVNIITQLMLVQEKFGA